MSVLTDMPRHRRPHGPAHIPTHVAADDLDDDDDREKPGQRNAANARERARMRILSKAFSRLKTTLPWVPPDTKLSKLDTLRLATSYIAHLRTILTDDGSPTPIVHPLNLTWPFTIQQQSPADASTSPAWSSPETSPPTHPRANLLTCTGDSSSCEGDGEDDLKHYAYGTDHRHFSDSLLNIG